MKQGQMKNRFPGDSAGKRRQGGAGLLEALIAFLVLAIGLMGLATLQMRSMQFNQAAYHRSQATMAADDILDRMRVNRSAAQADAYVVNYGASVSGSTIAQQDLSAWLTFLKSNLPEGDGSITCNSADLCTVKIKWKDRFSTVATDVEEFSISSQM